MNPSKTKHKIPITKNIPPTKLEPEKLLLATGDGLLHEGARGQVDSAMLAQVEESEHQAQPWTFKQVEQLV
jgi:hypothetical protein